MFIHDVFFVEEGKVLILRFEIVGILIHPFALHYEQYLKIMQQVQNASIINSQMRKKGVNTNSEPNIHQFNFVNLDPYSKQNSIGNNRIAPITHTPSIDQKISQSKISRGSNRYTPQGNNNKLGQEMNKMEDWMSDVYNKRRNENFLKKTTNSNLNYSNISVINQSQSRLKFPPINASLVDNQESKLVEQIRRVQNRIRELKYERNLASTQQQKYETIRPFMEMQSQNMMNMQLMMSMMQQSKQQHQCCSHNHTNNSNSTPQIIYIPVPQTNMPYSSNPQPPQHPQHYYPQQPVTHRGSLNKNKGKNIKNSYNLPKLRKFRAAVIAVYFYLMFPKFVNKFTKKRFSLHSQKYFKKSLNQPEQLLSISHDNLSNIDYYKVSQGVQRERKERSVRRVTNSKTAKLIISEENNNTKSYEIFLGDLQVFLLTLLKNIHQMINQGDFDELIKEIGVGYIPYSFPLDHSYLYEEIFRLKFHPKKIYLQIGQLQAKSLIMAAFFVKLLVYDFLFVVREDIEWKKKFLKKNNFKRSQMIEAQLVTTQMYISGILLHRYCMEILEGQVKDIEGNLDRIEEKNIPIPMGAMMYESKEQIKNDKQKDSKDSSEEQQQQQQQLENMFNFNYIKNLEEFETLTSQVRQKSGHQDEVKELISDITDQIYKKSIDQRKQEYKQITLSVVQQQKNLVTKNKGIQKLQFEMPKRTKQQKEEIKSFLKQMKEDRQKQGRGSEDQFKHAGKKLSMKNIKRVDPKDKKNKRK